MSSQSDKFGKIWVYSKSPFSNDYSNTIKFDSEEDITRFFETSSLLTEIYYKETCSWHRQNGTIQVEGNQSSFESATYMRFQNEEGRMWYAFVIDTLYTNHNTTEIIFEIDVWNSYQIEFWQNSFGGYVEQITQKNFREHNDASGRMIRNVLETNQGFNVGNRKAVNGATVELDIDWLVFVLLPSAKLNAGDNGNAGFPGTYKAFRYFVVPADITTGRTYDYTFDGTLVRGTSIQSYMAAFTTLFAEDGSTNTVNQCVGCYTSKYIGINYSLVDDVVFIDNTNLTGNIIGPNTNESTSGSTGDSGQGIAGGWLDGSVNYTGGTLTYGGNTLDSSMITGVILSCREYKLWPEAVIAQMYYESNWGNSNVARSDNNWSGIKYNDGWRQTCLEKCNVVITQGTLSPEGNYYARYSSPRDWLATHYYLLRDGGLYVASGKTSVRDYGRGLFKAYGAQADYATISADEYVNTLIDVASGIRSANGDSVIDQINKLAYDTTSIDNITGANVDSMISVAQSQIGYLEKASNSQLDDFTANPGSNNWTKYNRDAQRIAAYPSGTVTTGNGGGPNGWQWCATFLSWCANEIGLTKDTFPMSASCNTMIDWFRAKGRWYTNGTPQPGDLIVRPSHVAMVWSVSNGTITTIEGNTSDRVLSRAQTLSQYSGYGRPNYSNSLTSSGWTSNNAIDQIAGLKFLEDNKGRIFGDETSTASVAMYVGEMKGPNLGAGTQYSPPDLANGVVDEPNPQDAYFQYDWDAGDEQWPVVTGPINLADIKVGSVLSLRGSGSMKMPAASNSERDNNNIVGYIAVVKAKNTADNKITLYGHNNILGVFEATLDYDADTVQGANNLPDSIRYNDSEYNSSSSASIDETGDIVDGSYSTTITGVAAIEVIRLRRAVQRNIRIPDIFWMIDNAYTEILGNNYESQLLSGEFSYATLYDMFGNSYDFLPEKLPDPIGGEYQDDGYLPGNHILRATGSLGESNHVHYTIEDYNIVPRLYPIQTDQSQIEAIQNNEFSYGIKDSNPRSVTIISDRTAAFLQANSNQYANNLTAFAENYDMLKLNEQQNNAQLSLANEQATYNANYAVENARIGLATSIVNTITGAVGGAVAGGAVGGFGGAVAGGISGVGRGAIGTFGSYRGLGNAQQQQSFAEEANSLRSQSVALGNMQAKLALDQSIRAYNASIKDAQNQPDSIQQIGTDMSFQSGNRRDNIYLKIMIPSELQLINANKYIKGYGVVYNGWIEDIRDVTESRQKFNYIKCASLEVPRINANQSHLAALKSVFITGTRIWNYTSDIDNIFGDITTSNPDK